MRIAAAVKPPSREVVMKLKTPASASILSAFALVALASNPQAAKAEATVKVDGSSTVFPITEAVAEEFQIKKRGKVRVTVGVSGTGGGFKKFCRGETDISD